jgi:hypothetical protein
MAADRGGEEKNCPFCNAQAVPEAISLKRHYWTCGTLCERLDGAMPEQSLQCRVTQLEAVLNELEPFVVVKADPGSPYEQHLAGLAAAALRSFVPKT